MAKLEAKVMPKSCAVGCSNYKITDKILEFHLFPMEPECWRKWVNAVKRQLPDGSEWRPAKTIALCSEHFINNFIVQI